jgi:hypothetical protein
MVEQVDVYNAEFLAMAAGRQHGEPVLILTMRPESRSFRPCNFRFTAEQAIRIYKELGQLLNDPESWLHVGEEQGQRTEGE